MAGFRDYSLDRYLKKLNDTGYTSVVFIQSPEDIRILHNIYSPELISASEGAKNFKYNHCDLVDKLKSCS